MRPMKFRVLVFCLAISFASQVFAQSNFDLEPPMQVDAQSQQFFLSTDPSALPVFKFATAEIKDGEVIVSTTGAEQKLIAQMPGRKSIPAELDPKGIRYTEQVSVNYTVNVPYTEKLDDGTMVTRTRQETRTRSAPVTRYRERNAGQQAEYEKAVAAKKKKDAEKGVEEKPEIEVAKMKTVAVPYSVAVPYAENVDGKPVSRIRHETRMRTVSTVRGKTETVGKTVSSNYQIADVTAYSVAGKELDEAKIKECLADRAPVILVNSPAGISPYFESILKPETIFLVCPKKPDPDEPSLK